jgi:hypothetical protein
VRNNTRTESGEKQLNTHKDERMITDVKKERNLSKGKDCRIGYESVQKNICWNRTEKERMTGERREQNKAGEDRTEKEKKGYNKTGMGYDGM